MNIMIVEDDPQVGNFLKENLSREMYGLQWIRDLPSLLQELQERTFIPDLIVLDRLLGNLDTRPHLKTIKARYPEARIICLSALNSPAEKAQVLDEGADDYMGKPFSVVEFLARVRAQLRGKQNPVQNFYLSVGDLIIDTRSRVVISQGNKIQLKNKEYSLLLNFSQHVNRVFSKFELMDLIWEANLDLQSNVLEVTVMNLRKKLEESGSRVSIQSKRNVGYWLED